MRKFVNKTILYFNIVFVILLLLAYASVAVSPKTIWILAFFGLAYPFLLVINLIFTIFWIWRKKRYFLLSLVAILIGWNIFNAYIRLPLLHEGSSNQVTARSNHKTEFDLMSFNVRLFNAYDWISKPDIPTKIIDLLKSYNPEVLCFQEFYTEKKGNLNTRQLFENYKALPYSHIKYNSNGKKASYGIATFSKYPIAAKGTILFNNTFNICIFTDIVIGTDTVRIYNIHLQSNRFVQNNYAFIDSLRLRYDERQMEEIKDISSRLKHAFIMRSEQAEIVSEHAQKSPYPYIICGDFNDTPVSYTYQTLKNGRLDAFRESGKNGTGKTYRGRFPAYRIDYIMYNNKLRSSDYHKIKVVLSDHYPIMCTFSISDEPDKKDATGK